MDVKMYLVNILKAACPTRLCLGDVTKDTSDLIIFLFKCSYTWNFQELVDIISIFKKPVNF